MSKLIHVTDLSHAAFHLYKKHYREFLKILVWLLIPGVLMIFVPLLPTSTFTKDVINTALVIVSIVLSLWLSVVMIDLILQFIDKKPKVRKFWDKKPKTLGRIIDLILVSIVQGVVVGVWFLPWMIPIIVALFIGPDAVMTSLAVVIPVGIVLGIVGVMFWNWFSLARYAVLIDGVSPGLAALKASKNLVRGRFWKIAWRWIGSYLYFASLLFLGTMALISIIAAVTGQIGLIMNAQNPIWWEELINTVVAILSTPLFVGIGVLLYESAKQTK